MLELATINVLLDEQMSCYAVEVIPRRVILDVDNLRGVDARTFRPVRGKYFLYGFKDSRLVE